MGEGRNARPPAARGEKGLHLLLESRARDEHEVYDREDQRDEEEVAHRFPERVPVADARRVFELEVKVALQFH